MTFDLDRGDNSFAKFTRQTEPVEGGALQTRWAMSAHIFQVSRSLHRGIYIYFSVCVTTFILQTHRLKESAGIESHRVSDH